jgi:hypothetical protein
MSWQEDLTRKPELCYALVSGWSSPDAQPVAYRHTIRSTT